MCVKAHWRGRMMAIGMALMFCGIIVSVLQQHVFMPLRESRMALQAAEQKKLEENDWTRTNGYLHDPLDLQ